MINKRNKGVRIVEGFIFNSRWLLIPFYFGLIAALAVYTLVYTKEIWHLISHVRGLSKEIIALVILELIDIVMIANLVKQIITGSYNSFVDKKHGYQNENISSGMLKVKLSTSIINVAAIHLLQSFVQVSKTGWEELYKQLLIFGAFVVGAIALATIDYMHEKAEGFAHNKHDKDYHGDI